MQTTASKKIVRIEDLGTEINTLHKRSIGFKNQAVANGHAAVLAAVECGQLLLRAKRIVGHSKWMKWLADNCDISGETARRWMKIASNKELLNNLDKYPTLKDVYIAVGIMSAPQPTKVQRLCGATIDIYAELLSTLGKRVGGISNLFEDAPTSEWPQEKLEEARAKTAPLVRILWPDALPA